MNGQKFPVLFEFISVLVCHVSSCPITVGTRFFPLQVRLQCVLVLFKLDPICVSIGMIIKVNILFINFIEW